MIIDKNIVPFIVYHEDSIIIALQKISDNNSGIVFAINQRGIIEGVLTDGDIRRWMLSGQKIDLSLSVISIIKKDVVSCKLGDSKERILKHFNPQRNIKTIPLTDDKNHLVAIAKYEQQVIE